MPKRFGGNRNWKGDGGSGRDGGKYYYEHDDRVVSDNIRKVSFKSTGNRISKPGRARDYDIHIRTRLDDDDVDMSGSFGGKGPGRYIPYHNKGHRNQQFPNRRGRGGGGGRVHSPAPATSYSKVKDGFPNWYRVTIPFGSKYPKEYILKILLNYISPSVFIPIAYKTQGSEASFYVEDGKVADQLHAADRKITVNDGFKLTVKVRPGIPNIQLDSSVKEKMKQAMVKRFNPVTKALDLSKFHMDPELVDDCLAALYRANVMLAVVDIIAENIPELTALNLSDNKLYNIEHLSILTRKLPNLTVLHIGSNRIRDINQLNSLKGLKLTELVLDGNPLCDKFKEEGAYVSEVRKRFPKVMKLDGADLPPPIGFDVPDERSLPSAKGSFMCAQEGQLVVRQFLEQYYLIYDADNRQPLLDAYHNDAVFSMAATYPPGQSTSSSSRLNAYLPDSRNIMRIKDAQRRLKLLHQGKLTIVSALSQFPKTKHDLASFAVDLPIFNPQLMIVSLTGMFMETDVPKTPVRSFSRVFVIVPWGTGFCITNDMLLITNPTDEQLKVAFKRPVAATPTTTPVSSPPAPVVPQPVDNSVKEQMVLALAEQSNMNLLWSKKCLDDSQWDFQQALFVFTELFKQGKVPSEAFVK
ncbi:nuclear RNA export factor 1 [Anabrus simplex]|uniref:nuclear RNA export factor 1 n=1 Tax=Anabrus simplex TaxID=316456 RepID=UPI0035A39095